MGCRLAHIASTKAQITSQVRFPKQRSGKEEMDRTEITKLLTVRVYNPVFQNVDLTGFNPYQHNTMSAFIFIRQASV